MQVESLVRELQGFLADHRDAVVLEDGGVAFDLDRARYSISSKHGKCLLHLWSEERNAVRRVLDMDRRNGVVRLAVLRFGQTRPSTLEICWERDRRTPTARKAARERYEHVLQRALQRCLPDLNLVRLSSAMDLEHCFGPVYARGVLRKGRSAFAVLGVNSEEMQASIDAALTFGILWLDRCRQSEPANILVEGLKLIVPPGTSGVIRERMAHLDQDAAKWQLFEMDEREPSLQELDPKDRGNLDTRLLQCSNPASAEERFAESMSRMRELCIGAEMAVISPAEIGFRYHGLEFARARLATQANSFRYGQEIVFGVAGAETVLTEENIEEFKRMLLTLVDARQADGSRNQPLWRIHPERWLESLVRRDVRAVDGALEASPVYSQVPAFSASDRAMIDLLAATREGRLTVLELKADEDIHLPLQGVDYWARVQWHHARGEFTRFGYFPGRELSAESPRLVLVSPALHVHPASDTVLRYLTPEIDWMLVGVQEQWREAVRVVFRKRPSDLRQAMVAAD
ncbi:MAG TPA: hypothetical protein VFA76_11965 [Terriglobales bacterium]|nr:hypothetical protein [Terriglobales bacterium]